MKQLYIGANVAYAAGASKLHKLSGLTKGSFAFFDLESGEKLTAKAVKDFAVVLGRGTDADGNAVQPLVFPEVNVASLSVTKATKQAGAKFSATITIPSPVVGEDYTIVVVKKGVGFHERNTWTVTHRAKTGDNATKVATNLVDQLKGSTETSGVTATNSAGAVTISGVAFGDDYEVKGADALMGVAPSAVTQGVKATLDAAYVKELASKCTAGKGFNYTAEDAHEMYPGYPEEVPAGDYVLYTLRFAVPRKSAKQRDEVVSQLVHLAVPEGSAQIASIEAVLGLATASASGTEDGPIY